jgi:hypothetical protein
LEQNPFTVNSTTARAGKVTEKGARSPISAAGAFSVLDDCASRGPIASARSTMTIGMGINRNNG